MSLPNHLAMWQLSSWPTTCFASPPFKRWKWSSPPGGTCSGQPFCWTQRFDRWLTVTDLQAGAMNARNFSIFHGNGFLLIPVVEVACDGLGSSMVVMMVIANLNPTIDLKAFAVEEQTGSSTSSATTAMPSPAEGPERKSLLHHLLQSRVVHRPRPTFKVKSVYIGRICLSTAKLQYQTTASKQRHP